MPNRSYTTAEGIVEARRRIAVCARQPEGGALDLGGLSLDDAALAELMPALASLPPLKRLNLGVHAAQTFDWRPTLCNSLTVLPGFLLDAHTELEALNFSYNSIGARGLCFLARLPNLKDLNLRGCGIMQGDTWPLAQMACLKSLDLGRTRLRALGARHMAGLVNLTSLNLDTVIMESGIGDAGAKHLAELINLTRLGLRCNHISASGLQHLAGLQKLTELHLGGNPLHGSYWLRPVSEISGITSLDLSFDEMYGPTIDDDVFVILRRFKKLASLFLFDHHYRSGRDDECWVPLAALSELTTLDLRISAVDDEEVRAIGSLAKLTHLYLGRNKISSCGVRHLEGLINLNDLDLGHNAVGNAGAACVRRMAALEFLDLSSTGVTDLSPLLGLQRLRTLDARNWQGEIHAPTALWMKPSLEELYIWSINGIPADVLAPFAGGHNLGRDSQGNCLAAIRAYIARHGAEGVVTTAVPPPSTMDGAD